ncbi:uncharacterized protein LOC142592628 [Dermacentor variabilis]|uniref:uncharacterized protein LOC142592628 n=1 Tax=Dermacentor variabilis TaxID=34621 RepID=UPI003F5BAB3A
MSSSVSFLLVLLLPVSMSETCYRRESVFDRGLRKLLGSDRFSEIDLPDFMQNVDEFLNVRAGFSDGVLRGLGSTRRSGEAVLRVHDSGSRLTFHVVGGPLEVYYAAGLRAGFLRATVDLRARIPHFQASFTVQESSPNELRVEVHGVRMSRIRLLLDEEEDVSLDGALYDIVFDQLRPFIQKKVGEALVQELRKLAADTLGAVELYAVASTERTARAEDSPITREWKEGLNAASRYLALTQGRRSNRRENNAYSGSSRHIGRLTEQRLEPDRARRRRPLGVFDGCLKTLVVSTGFEPAPLPDDLEPFAFSVGQVQVTAGSVTGLSNVSVNGHSWTSVGECGLRARFDLAFKDVRVRAAASVGAFFVSTSATFDLRIPALEAVLEIQETENSLRVITYNLTFTSNVTVTTSTTGAVGTVFDFFGGLPEKTLEDEDLQLLSSSSLKYVQRVVDAVRSFIADPPPVPMP